VRAASFPKKPLAPMLHFIPGWPWSDLALAGYGEV
jgi:hypothetical protein